MNESIENLRKKVLKWKKTFESKKLHVNLKKIKIIVKAQNKEYYRAKSIHVPSVAKG